MKDSNKHCEYNKQYEHAGTNSNIFNKDNPLSERFWQTLWVQDYYASHNSNELNNDNFFFWKISPNIVCITTKMSILGWLGIYLIMIIIPYQKTLKKHCSYNYQDELNELNNNSFHNDNLLWALQQTWTC